MCLLDFRELCITEAGDAQELLLKARWLAEHNNQTKCLHVLEKRVRPNGVPYKQLKLATTACGNPRTHSWEFLARKMVAAKQLPVPVLNNLVALGEIRDSAVHFYNRNSVFALQLQEVGSAAVRNYVKLVGDWFDVDLSQFSFYLMPLSFLGSPTNSAAIVLNKEERRLATFIRDMTSNTAHDRDFEVAITVEVRFARSSVGDAMAVHLSNDANATKVYLTEQQVQDKWPYTYETLTAECRKRYTNFVANETYHTVRKSLKASPKYCHVRELDPGNPKSAKQERYSRAIFTQLDRHYAKQC